MLKNQCYYYLNSNQNPFNSFIDFPNNLHFDFVNVLNCSIDMSYYMIQDGLNQFLLTEDILDVYISVPEGNYSADALIDELTLQLNNNSPNGYTYVLSLETNSLKRQTGKIHFSVNTLNNVSFSFPEVGVMHKLMGFERNTINLFISGVLVSVNVCDFTTYEMLYLHTDIIEPVTGSDIIQSLMVENFIPYSKITYQNNTPDYNKKKVKYSIPKNITFYLTDENNNIIDLNGGSISLTLVFYNIENINNVIKHFIRYMIDEAPNN